MTLAIIDAQIHVWGSGLPSNRAHWQVTSFSAAEAIRLMDGAGVDGAVIHPPSWDPGSEALAIDAVREYPGRFAILGSVPLDDPASRARIAGWRDRPGMLGLRCLLLGEPRSAWVADGTLDWFWEAAADAGVPVTLLATDSLEAIGRIAERHPRLRLTIDHLGGRGGNTTLKDDAAMTHLPQLLSLARHPNVAVKATGVPGYSGEPWPHPTMQGHVRRVFDAFGAERVFWGTDISKMPCSWRQCVALFTEEMSWLTGRDLDLVMGEGICRWWGWQRGG